MASREKSPHAFLVSETRPLILFDGVCGLCDTSVQWILARDHQEQFLFATLQGETTAGLRERFPEIPSDLSTMVFVDRDAGHVYVRSRAIFQILKRLDQPYRAISYFRFLPAFLTDLGYRLVASLRYKIWGKLEACRVPTPDERARFLA